MLVVLLLIAAAALPWISTAMERHTNQAIFVLGAVGIWRWGWGSLHVMRALIYRYWMFPRLRRKAEAAFRRAGPIPDVAVVGTTYHEKWWITHAFVNATVRELASLRGLVRPPQFVMVTGSPEDDRQVLKEFKAAVAEFTPMAGDQWPPTLVLGSGDKGKRPAIGLGLRHVADRGMHPDGIVVLIDGDSAGSGHPE